MAKKKSDDRKVVSENRKARFNYAIDDTVEAGEWRGGEAWLGAAWRGMARGL